MPQQRSKRWLFVLNNYTAEEESLVRDLESQQDIVAYLVCGKELGEQGTPHLQGYIELNSRRGMRHLKGLLGRRVHVEIARGSLQSNQDYCKKEGDYFESGTPIPSQGTRTDLLSVKEDLDAGMQEDAIAEKHFSAWVRYSQSFQKYRALKSAKDRSWKTKVFVLWGETGTGKTRYVYDQIGDNQRIWVPGDYEWFDGYTGQEIVLFDDFRGEYPIQFLLKLLDRYPMSVKIKGSFTKWCPKKIYITSNVSPEDWYLNIDQRTRAALLRRIDNSEYVEVPLYADIIAPQYGNVHNLDLTNFIVE